MEGEVCERQRQVEANLEHHIIVKADSSNANDSGCNKMPYCNCSDAAAALS